ncbi:MAG: hypothetical protein IBX50_13345 [Marinospirillum sp.]|uniref:hypothetical protein n=1 Tax=Marinospirillum sp. TaxID=2183934 RepID=UPI001A0ED11E|nr:hypothetical protein [Marinospirillum sp.]MBE0507674.1 hypothetical protein [Marinospirillum sp.]
MLAKYNPVYRMLEKYGILVYVDNEILEEVGNLPEIDESCTLKQWKEQVFGDADTEVDIYIPKSYSGNKKISSLINDGYGDYLRETFTQVAKVKDASRRGRVREVKENVTKAIESRYERFSLDTLEDYLEEHKEELEPAVAEFLQRYITDSPDDLDTENLMSELIRVYNEAIKALKKT